MRKFKNFKLHTKFVWSFIVVALMAFLIGLASILSLVNMRNSDEQMYKENTAPMADLIVMYDLMSAQRICASNMALYLETDPAFSSGEALDLNNKETEFEAAFAHFKTSLKENEELAAYDEISGLYFGEFKPVKQALRDAYAAGDHAAMIAALRSIDNLGSDISDAMDKSMGFNVEYAAAKVTSNQDLFKISVIVVCAIVFVALLIALFEARFLTKLIADPIGRILEATKQVGEFGDFNFPKEAIEAAKRDAQYKDEVGQTMASFTNMMDNIVTKVNLLGDIAEGDLSMTVPKVSNADTMGNALEKMLDSLNEMFSGITMASNQVSTGSNQIASGAQQLAQATTEQASTVDLLSRSVGDVTEKTQANTKLAERAAKLGGTIKQNAESGSEQMKRMTKAVNEINEASNSISTVIKVIDDIAFQTNILALNAAVEAARAGEAGKGFAVVADEVRNLAGKSADAAKNTSALIEDSVQKAELGARIARETSGALEDIVSGINESSAIVARMASASAEQLLAIQEINSGIDQVTEVVQQNSATAEQSAAASEEMNNQAAVLNDLVNHFRLRNEG